jgi:hypothetical protein
LRCCEKFHLICFEHFSVLSSLLSLFCYSKIMKILFRFQKIFFRARKSLSMMMIGVIIWREILTTRVWSDHIFYTIFHHNFLFFSSSFQLLTYWRFCIDCEKLKLNFNRSFLVAKTWNICLHNNSFSTTNYSHFTRSISSLQFNISSKLLQSSSIFSCFFLILS